MPSKHPLPPPKPRRPSTYIDRVRAQFASGERTPAYLEDPCGPALLDAWRRLVDPGIAAHTRPLRLLDDTLTVGVEYPLTLLMANAAIGEDIVDRLCVELGEAHPPVRRVRLMHYLVTEQRKEARGLASSGVVSR